MSLHPQTVHFPIALLIAAGVLYVLPFWKRDPLYERGGFLLHIAGVVTLVLAILTGIQAEAEIVHTQAIHQLARNHELLGYAAIWLFGMMLVWRYLRQSAGSQVEKILFVCVFWALLGLMGYSAHLGGKMVYEEGAGVAPMEEILREQFRQEQE